MAKKLADEVKKVEAEAKALEVELVAKVKSAFHTVCTQFGNVLFTDGKAVVAADQKQLIDELQKINVVEEVKPVEPALTPAPALEQPKNA